MKIEIRTPKTAKEWEAYYDLRYRILRAPLDQPKGSERTESDASGTHLALYDNGTIKAVAKLDRAEPGISQTRFVAVEEATRGKGYGRKIMEATEKISVSEGNHTMIVQARDYAVDFYLNLGYSIVEKSHLLYGVLQHYKMKKKY